MKVEIAAQACILVLELGIEWYEGWSEIIVYPSQFAPEREVMDEAGVVHLTNDPMAGEAWLGGPVVLSYEDVAMAGDEDARVAGLQRRDPRVRAQARHAQRRRQRLPAAACGHEHHGVEARRSRRRTRISARAWTRPTRCADARDAGRARRAADRSLRRGEPGRILRRGLGSVLRNARAARARVSRRSTSSSGSSTARIPLARLYLVGLFDVAPCRGVAASRSPSPRGLLRPSRSASSISFASASRSSARHRALPSRCRGSATCSFRPSLYWRVAS